MSILGTLRVKKTILLNLGLIFLTLIGFIVVGITMTNYEYDPVIAAQYATEHANKKSVSLCAYYIRKSIEAGGCPTFLHPQAACEYPDFLLCLDFSEISSTDSIEIGDIVIFKAVANHPYGHIAIWNGTQWISDFRQRNIIVAKEYQSADARFFRLFKGKHRRKLLCMTSVNIIFSKLKHS